MPSFFEVFKRMVQGKPVFDASDEMKKQMDQSQAPGQQAGEQTSQPRPQRPPSTIQKGNASTYPVVYVRHVTRHLNGPNMQCYAAIRNNSTGNIELDKIRLLGTARELDSFLRPGEERQYEIYNGPRPTSSHYDEVELDYKDQTTGDYFSAIHDVEFDYQPDKTYALEELKLRLPIRDI